MMAVFICGVSFAATKLSGQGISDLDLNSLSGHVDLSFSKIDRLIGDRSGVTSIMAFRMRSGTARISNLNLSVADFSSVVMPNAQLRNLNLAKALFRDANLNNAYLDGKVSNCSFDKADLRGANLKNVTFSNCTFWGALFNNATQLPFDPMAETEKGMIYVP